MKTSIALRRQLATVGWTWQDLGQRKAAEEPEETETVGWTWQDLGQRKAAEEPEGTEAKGKEADDGEEQPV